MIPSDWAAQEARLLMNQIRTERCINRTREAVLCLKAEDKIIAVLQRALETGKQEGFLDGQVDMQARAVAAAQAGTTGMTPVYVKGRKAAAEAVGKLPILPRS